MSIANRSKHDHPKPPSGRHDGAGRGRCRSYGAWTNLWERGYYKHVAPTELAIGGPAFGTMHGKSEFYATEFTGDLEQQPGVRAWVTILERKVYP